jgi:hypothetical protein
MRGCIIRECASKPASAPALGFEIDLEHMSIPRLCQACSGSSGGQLVRAYYGPARSYGCGPHEEVLCFEYDRAA